MQMTEATPFEMRGGRVVAGGQAILHGVDFELRNRELVALLGHNGSGKTTLVRALLGLIPLSGGTTKVFGVDPRRFRDWARIGYVPQRFTAQTGVPATVWEVVLSGRTARTGRFRPFRRADRAAAQRAAELALVSHLAGRSVETLSGGEQRRVLIARALAGEPDVLVLDEPLSGVDAASQEALAGTLESLLGEGHSILLVEHALGPLLRLIDRVVILEDGRVVFEGSPHHPEALAAQAHHHHEDEPAPRGGPQ